MRLVEKTIYCLSTRFGSILFAVIILVPYILAVATNVYLPVTDEAYQLEAAINIASGYGYVASRELGNDLAATSLQYVTAWPRGYSLVISWMIGLGLNASQSAIIIKILAIIFSVWGWIKVSRFTLNAVWVKIAFSAFLGFYLVVVSTSASDLILFFIFSQLVIFLVKALSDKSDKAARYWGIVGVLCGVSVLFKYTALPVVLLSTIVYVWGCWKNKIIASPRNFLIFIIPATVIVGGVFVVNYIQARSISTITDIGLPIEFSLFRLHWVTSFLHGFLIDAPFLPKIVFDQVLSKFGHDIASLCKFIYEILALLIIVGALLRKWSVEEQGKLLRNVSVAALLSVLTFLSATTFLFYNGSDYNPLEHGRYYQYVVPLVVIHLLSAMESILKNKLQNSSMVMAAVAFVFVAGFSVSAFKYSGYLDEIMRTESHNASLVFEEINKIRYQEKAENLIIFADGDSFHSAPWRGQYRTYFQCPKHDELNFSRDTLAIMVCGRQSSRVGLANHDSCDEIGFSELAKTESFNELVVGNGKSVFWKLMKKNI